MECRPAGWSVCLPLLIFPCSIKSRSSLLAPAHPGGLGKRAVKRLCVCVCVCVCCTVLSDWLGRASLKCVEWYVKHKLSQLDRISSSTSTGCGVCDCVQLQAQHLPHAAAAAAAAASLVPSIPLPPYPSSLAGSASAGVGGAAGLLGLAAAAAPPASLTTSSSSHFHAIKDEKGSSLTVPSVSDCYCSTLIIIIIIIIQHLYSALKSCRRYGGTGGFRLRLSEQVCFEVFLKVGKV